MADKRVLLVKAGDPAANLEPLAATLANAGWMVDWAEEVPEKPLGWRILAPIPEPRTCHGCGRATRCRLPTMPDCDSWKPKPR